MWLGRVWVCVLVWTTTAEYAVDYSDKAIYSEDDYPSDHQQNNSTVQDSWNTLVKFLLGTEYGGENPWLESRLDQDVQADQPSEHQLSVDSLKGLDDKGIWEKIISKGVQVNESESAEVMLKDDASTKLESRLPLGEHSEKVSRKNDSRNYLSYPVLVLNNSTESNFSSGLLVDVTSELSTSREVEERALEGLLQEEYQSDSAGPKDAKGSSTLAFVFDTTGSMWDDLVQVRHGAAKIMETMLQRPDKPIYDYVLVPFHDPQIGPVTVTTDHKLLMQRLNEIHIYGGGDCPEASVGAVMQALQLSRPNSYIYVFTDARAKDDYLINQVLPLIQRKQSQVVFVMTGDCGDQTHPGYQVYHKIAATSSGQVYNLNKTDVDEVLSFVRVSLQSRKVNLLSVERPAAQNGSQLPLAIDETLKEFTVSVSGSNASIDVKDPDGHTVQAPQLTPLLDLQNVKVVNVKEPPPGTWTLQVGSDSSHTVRSTGLSGSDFVHGFSVIPTTNIGETYHRPLKSAANSVLIRATEPDNLYNFTKLELVHLNGTVVDIIPLCPVPDQPGLYSGGPFTPPNDLFYLSVSGYGKDNFPIRRITATAISAQPPELPTVSIASSYLGQTGQPLTLVCRVESLVPFTVQWFKNGAKSMTKALKYNQTAEVPLQIEVVTQADAGRYTCKVQIPNVRGVAIKDTKLLVTGPPPTVVTQKEVTARIGVRTELECRVSSDMAYNVSWYRLNSNTPEGTNGKPSLELLTGSPRVLLSSNNSVVIMTPDLSDAGWYVCTAHNKGGHTSGRVYLTLEQPPALRLSPIQQEFRVGSHLSVHCYILAGIPQPSITWRRNSIIIQGEEVKKEKNHWVLILRDMQKKDEGVYTCEAKNSAGTAYGTTELLLLEVPQVHAVTASQLIQQGHPVELQCHVSGAPVPQLTWYKDSAILSPDHPRVQISPDGQLHIHETNQEDTGLYACVARNKVGTAKDSIDLQVGTPPRVVHLPSDLTVPIGGSDSMLCAAIGIPVPHTIWSKNGQPLQSSTVFVSEQGELFIKDAQLEDEGNYTCTVENSFGTATYHVDLKITGIVAPKLMTESLPTSTKALLGHATQLPCPVLAGNPPPSRQWYKDGVLLDAAQYQINSDGSLLLTNISADDKGLYECIVSNVGGRDSITTNLDILVPPRILTTEQDSEVKVVEGNSLSLSCPVSGQPVPAVSWLRYGKRLSPSQQDNSSLWLSNVTVHQAGSYTCLAISAAGTDSRSVTLQVLVPPKISLWKENVTVSEGHYARLECHVTANPPANISWYHERQQLPYHSRVVRFFVNKTMEGQYKCVAENEVGSSTQLVNLYVSVVPRIDAQTKTKFFGVAGEEIRLLCPATGDPKPTVTWSKPGSTITRHVSEDGSVVLTGLTPADSGTYFCSATNVAGSAVLPISLDILVRPVITGWETEVSVLEGKELSVSCEAEAEPPALVTWLRDGRLIATHGSSLKFVAEKDDAGNYTCIAENQVGRDQQELVLIVVVPAQIYNNHEESVHLFSNSSETQLVCHTDGVPQPVVSWFKNSFNVTGDINPKLRVEGNVLSIVKASEDLAGQYVCHAENIAGIAQKIFEVEFYEPPKILDQSPTNITLREGDDYTIPCSAAGLPTPTVKWKLGQITLPPGFQNDELVVMEDKMLVLTQVSLASEAQFTCEAESAAGRASRNYSVHIIVPPVAMDRSVTQLDIVESNTGVLTCPVHQGMPHSSIEWLKDGVPISLGVNERADDTHYNLKDGGQSLKIVEARSDDGGMYTCVVTNLAGRTQASFAVEVLVHPHFSNEYPETEFIKAEGERLVLDCSVGGNPEPKISWKRVELGLPVTQHTTPGVMLELPSRWRLIIPAVRHHHSGTYQCAAVNKLGRETRRFTVRVTAPPELDGPREETVEAALNETVVLQCRVWGTPPPLITWDFSNTSVGFLRIPNDNLDMRVMELPVIAASHAGLYRCTADNSLGSVNKLFNVTISEPPRIERSEFIEELRVGVEGELELTCDVSGSPPPVVSWLHNGHVISNHSHSSGQTHVLQLSPVTTTSGGKYSCVATNKAGVAEKTFKVKALVPPRISESYQFSADPRVVVVEGLPLTIRCPVTGTPPPNITWHKDGKLLDKTSELIAMEAAHPSEAGNYTCTATNHVGSVSKSFIIDVHVPPALLGQDAVEQIEVLSKTLLRLNCSVTAHPLPTIMWLKGAEPLLHPAVTLENSNQTLIISSVGLQHSGRYSCLASNIAGAVEKTFNIYVIEPPSVMGDEAAENGPPTGQRVMLHRKTVLECSVSGSPQPNITWSKDGESLTGHQVSVGGRFLHIMNALPKHGGNYSCVAENQAGTTQLFLPVTVVLPLQWTEWTAWAACSKSCGGGKEVRDRHCGQDTHVLTDFVELDTSDCVGDKVQSRPCNVLPCQVHGGWSEWTNWTSCSESCGGGTRRRYRHCDSPAPALGGNPCFGSDGQQEPCIIQPCPVQSNWGEWTEWSRCSAQCGSGTKYRARHCLRGNDLATDCEGPNQEVMPCTNRKCPVDGKWTVWGPWGQCSTSCGRGLRQRHRICSKRLYGGKPCFGDNVQIEKCSLGDCIKTTDNNPQSASLRIRGKLNGEKVEDMYLDADIKQDGPKRLVTATLKDILKAQANWFPYLTFLVPPVSWEAAPKKDNAKTGFSLSNGNFTEESRYQFATGQELVVKHVGKGVDKKGAFKVDIEVRGDVPFLQPTSSVLVNPYTEDYVRTGPNSLYTSSRSALEVDGERLPFVWNRTVTFDTTQGTMPYLAESLSTDEVASEYNAKHRELNFKSTSKISKRYRHNTCPLGFKLDPHHQHCSDIDECKELKKACHRSQICENQFGSYRCQCRPGFRLSSNGVKCEDINECVESSPCSHNCHNTKGSFYCSCPPQLALSHTGLTCKAWGDLDMVEPTEDYIEEDVRDDDQFLEAKAVESIACRPGLQWQNNSCSDVDECLDEGVCGEEEICINTQGSFHCLGTPCFKSFWDQPSRSCISLCEDLKSSCAGDMTVAEFVRHLPVRVNHTTLQPYQELAALEPRGLTNEPLGRTVYDITDNVEGVPLRIRIENGQGILYAMKYFQINGIHRITIKASSFSKDYKKKIYTTQFVVFLYAE